MTHKDFLLDENQLLDAYMWWAKALDLENWDIKITIDPPSALEDGADGTCCWNANRYWARIQLADPQYREPDEKPYDMEYVLVHELLHIVLAHWDDITRGPDRPLNPVLETVCIEQPIDRLAQLLVNMRRAEGPCPFIGEYFRSVNKNGDSEDNS